MLGKSWRINETSLDGKVVEESPPFQPVGSNLDGYGGDRGGVCGHNRAYAAQISRGYIDFAPGTAALCGGLGTVWLGFGAVPGFGIAGGYTFFRGAGHE